MTDAQIKQAIEYWRKEKEKADSPAKAHYANSKLFPLYDLADYRKIKT